MKLKRTLLNLTYAGVGAMVAILTFQVMPSYAKGEKPLPKIVVDSAPVERDGKFTTSFAPIIKKAAPSVVNIFTTHKITEKELRSNPFFNDPLFREFFGDPGQRRGKREEQSLGSGVIVSPEGYILTSNHVVEGADEIRVQMASGREYTAKVIGTDPPTDTAVLKIDNDGDLPSVTLADSGKLEVGDVVLAIGNPFGIGQTVTMGIVSATGRGDLGIVDYEDFIQTDASINPGNSGGALVDAQGRLVGINTAILSRTGGNQGVGFAIPVNLSRNVMERLITDGKVSRGFLGVALQPLSPDLSERFDLKEQGGALVAGVEEGTPAAEAGIKPGDVIIEFNGKKVIDYRQLRLMVSQTPPNTKTTFGVMREGKRKNFEVKLATLPTERTMSGMMRRGAQPEEQTEALSGVEVTDLDSRSRRQYGIPSHIRGALVTGVDPDSNAFDKGLREGDVILEIERKPVTNAEDAVKMTENFEGDKVMLRVWSQRAARYIVVPVDKKNEAETQEDRRPNRDNRNENQ